MNIKYGLIKIKIIEICGHFLVITLINASILLYLGVGPLQKGEQEVRRMGMGHA